MPSITSFTNNFKNILDKLNNVIASEFGNTLPTFIGNTEQEGRTQYILINPLGSDSIDISVNGELREYTFNLGIYFKDKNVNEDDLDSILRILSRLEASIHENFTMTLSDSTTAFNCKIDSTELDADEDNEEYYIVNCNYTCQHIGNVS